MSAENMDGLWRFKGLTLYTEHPSYTTSQTVNLRVDKCIKATIFQLTAEGGAWFPTH